MPIKSFLAAAFIAAIAVPAMAQTMPEGTPTRIRGTVETFAGNELAVKSRDGRDLEVKLAANVAVVAVVKRKLSEIKPGDFVACTSARKPDGSLHAVEVRIFPESMRGRGEGQHPWDLMPNSMMTNATVGKITQAPNATVLHVTYKNGQSNLIVAPGVPILSYVAADTSLLKPGAAVFIGALKHADGTLTASRITAEKDGVKPPM